MEKKIFLINSEASLWLDINKDSNTEFGIIKSEQLKKAKAGSKIKTHIGKVFFVVEPSAPDLFRKMIRLPQIITLKDMGSVLAYSGIKANSKILEAGTGSAFATCVMASFAKEGKVVSYERRGDFAKVANKNVALYGLQNVSIINADIKKGVKQKEFDFVLLDLPDPWEVIPTVIKSIKVGGRLCTYSPSIIQVERTLKSLPASMKVERLISTVENNWKVDLSRDILRPESDGITHTAFLLFSRKIEK
ncbi:MAG: methyltransferase domain-containing protein [Candidatus Parvarchaeota archaeon]|nr:methyltransferase domain-containing protein [Candidatus Parvarchaeota archaeon]